MKDSLCLRLLRKMAMASLNRDFVIKASVVMVVYEGQKISSTYCGHRGETLHYLQDTAAATQNILLTGHLIGFGTCWVGAIDEDKVRETLHGHEKLRSVAMIPVGYPKGTPLRESNCT